MTVVGGDFWYQAALNKPLFSYVYYTAEKDACFQIAHSNKIKQLLPS